MKKSEDIARAERERKVRDLWKVFNPTNQDFQVGLNMAVSPEIWTIHANSEEIVPMYVADKYYEEMSDKIIYDKADKAVIEENEKRMARGFNKMDVHTEQFRFESPKIKSMMSKKDQLREVLIRGLYKEYGIGTPTTQQEEYDRRSFATDSQVDAVLGLPTTPKPVEPAVEPIVEPQPGVDNPKLSPYEQKLANLTKAREARKVKNETNG